MSNEKIKSNKNKQTLQEKYEILLKQKNNLQNKCRRLEKENIDLKMYRESMEWAILEDECRRAYDQRETHNIAANNIEPKNKGFGFTKTLFLIVGVGVLFAIFKRKLLKQKILSHDFYSGMPDMSISGKKITQFISFLPDKKPV